jgi:predicted MFS family arabinose efflux permease
MTLHRKVHVVNFGRKLAVNAVFFLIPLHFIKLGFKGWEIGFVTSLYAFAPILFSFPTGWINDRFSIKEVIRCGLASFTLLYLLLAGIRSFWPMAIIFLLLGVANNALDISLNSLYFKDQTAMDQNRKYSRLAFWQSLGSAAGPVIGGAVVTLAGFPWLFAGLAVFASFIQAFVPSLERVKFAAVPMKVYKGNLLRPNTVLFSVMIFLVGLHWGLEGTVYGPFLKQRFQLSMFSLSLYISFSLLALALSSLLVGFIPFDIRLNKRIFAAAMFMSGTGLMLMTNSSLPLSFAFRLVHEFGDGLMGALIVLFISRLFERDSIGGSFAVLLTVMTFGHMVGALVFSSLGFRFGLIYAFIVAGGLLVGDSVFSLYCFRKAEY